MPSASAGHSVEPWIVAIAGTPIVVMPCMMRCCAKPGTIGLLSTPSLETRSLPPAAMYCFMNAATVSAPATRRSRIRHPRFLLRVRHERQSGIVREAFELGARGAPDLPRHPAIEGDIDDHVLLDHLPDQRRELRRIDFEQELSALLRPRLRQRLPLPNELRPQERRQVLHLLHAEAHGDVDIPEVAQHRKPELPRFVDHGLQLLVGDRGVDLDHVHADRREVPDVRARLRHVLDVARPERSRRARQQGTEHPSARHEEARPLHDAALLRRALRDDPRRVAVNVADRGHAMRQVERDLPAAQVEVHVDQAREDRPSVGLDDVRAGGHRDLSSPADRRDAVTPDHDDRVLDGGAAPAVDQRAALEDEHGLLRRERGRAEHCEQHRENPQPHDFLL